MGHSNELALRSYVSALRSLHAAHEGFSFCVRRCTFFSVNSRVTDAVWPPYLCIPRVTRGSELRLPAWGGTCPIPEFLEILFGIWAVPDFEKFAPKFGLIWQTAVTREIFVLRSQRRTDGYTHSPLSSRAAWDRLISRMKEEGSLQHCGLRSTSRRGLPL